MKFVVALSGKQYAGKDSLANALLNPHLAEYGYQKRSIADAIKLEYYRMQAGWDQRYDDATKLKMVDNAKTTDPEVRPKLIALGQEIRAKDERFLMDRVFDTPSPFIIVPDLRFLHEIEYIFLGGWSYVVRVNASDEIRKSRGVVSCEDSPSETELDDMEFDAIVNNNADLASLAINAETLASQILLKMSGLYSCASVSIGGQGKDK